MTRKGTRLRTWLAAAAASTALAGVFAWYLQPDFMLTLADQLWACF